MGEVVIGPEWILSMVVLTTITVLPSLMTDVRMKFRPLPSLLLWSLLLGAVGASLLTPDWFGWGSWRHALAGPWSIAAVLLLEGVLDTQEALGRWSRCMRGRATAEDAVALLKRRVTDDGIRTQVCDAMSRSPEDPLHFTCFHDWPGRESTVAPRTVVRWLRSGEPPVRLWQMLCVGKDDAAIRAHLDGAEPVDWAAVETLAALRVAAY